MKLILLIWIKLNIFLLYKTPFYVAVEKANIDNVGLLVKKDEIDFNMLYICIQIFQ